MDDVPTKAKTEKIVEGIIEDGHNAREIMARVTLSRITLWRQRRR